MSGSAQTKRVEVYLQHGWSFDASCWQPWLDTAPEGWSYLVADRGYSRRTVSFSSFSEQQAIHIVVAHSFGLHLTPPDIFAAGDLLVILSSFRQFDQRAARGIKRMSVKLAQEPETVLRDFRINCFGSAEAPAVPVELDVALLQNDLLALAEQELDLLPPAAIPRILILHGAEDTVVRPEQAHILHELLPNSKLVIHAEAGHALPFTHQVWCQKEITRELAVADREVVRNRD